MNSNREAVIEAYNGDYRIIHEERNYPDLYHFEGPHGEEQAFETPQGARLYADIYELVGGIDEAQTGDRGVPPSVARASEDARMTYLAIQMSIPYAAGAFEVDETTIHDAIDRLHKRAREQRRQADIENDSKE